MIYEEFIAEVARRLEWPEEKVVGFIQTILDVVSAELKMNNSVVLDDFGTLKTDIQPEYILVDPETKERFLMPPAVEIIFEGLSLENEAESFPTTNFIAAEELHNEINSSFSPFEPTPLDEGLMFPGIPELEVGEQEKDDDAEVSVGDNVEDGTGVEDEKDEKLSSPPRRSRSRQGLRRNKKTLSVWIPIAGGIAIVVASLFFFKGDRSRG